MTREVGAKQPFMDRYTETSVFRPSSSSAGLLLTNLGGIGQYRRAFRRRCDDVDVLQDQCEPAVRVGDREGAQGPRGKPGRDGRAR